MRHPWIAGLFLLALLVAFRALGAIFTNDLPNFSPLLAVFLFSIVFLRGWQAWLIPLAAWVVSNPLATWLQGHQPFAAPGAELTALGTLLGIGLLALALRGRAGPLTMLGASLGGALLFHLATGVGAWITYPLYEKTLGGLWASVWTGPYGAELPSWVFLRNLALANLLFTGICLAARREIATSPSAASLPQTR